MKKLLNLKYKRIEKADEFLKKSLSKKCDFHILSMPLTPYLSGIVNYLITISAESYHRGLGIDRIIIDCPNGGDLGIWLGDRDEYIRRGRNLLENKKITKKIEKDFIEAIKSYYSVIRKLEKKDIRNPKKDFIEFLNAYIKEYTIAYSLSGPVTIGYGDVLIKELLNKYKNSEEIKSAINFYTRPTHNFVYQESCEFQKIVSHCRKNNILCDTKEGLDEGIRRKIEKHQKKYYWLNNNYKYVSCLGFDYFFNRLREELRNGGKMTDNKETRKSAFKILKKDKDLLIHLGRIAGLQDERKKANLIANYWLMEFVKIVAKAEGISTNQLQMASFMEIVDFFMGEKISQVELFERAKNCMIVTFKNGRDYYLTGKDYAWAKGILFKKEERSNSGLIIGISASAGRVQGTAKVILSPETERGKMRRGDILVTSMTRPEFMSLVRLAKGIITNEGGVTSHAAVIAREFGIPCVVGTNNATSIIKDGDLVEVDANEGVVKIIKK